MLISPTELEDRFNSFEESIISVPIKSRKKIVPLVGAFFLICFVLWLNGYADKNIQKWNVLGGFSLFPYINKSVTVTIVFSTLLFFWKRVRRDLFYLSASVAILITNSIIQIPTSEKAFSIPLILLIALFSNVSGFLFLKTVASGNAKKREYVIFSTVFWIVLIGFNYFFLKNSFNSFIFLAHLKFQLFWFFITAYFFQKNSGDIDPLLALNPINSLRFAIWPSKSQSLPCDSLDIPENWWRGFVNVFLGYVLLFVRMAYQEYLEPLQSGEFAFAFSQYFLTLIGDVAMFSVLTGLSRMLLFKVIDATKFVFLSETPAQIWQRGSIYNYLFIVQYVYFPLVRFAKGTYFPTVAAMTIFFTNHFGFLNLIYSLSSFFNLKLNLNTAGAHNVKYLFTYLILWILLIRISSRIWFFNYEDRRIRWKAWVSVLLTHTSYILVIMLARYINFFFRDYIF